MEMLNQMENNGTQQTSVLMYSPDSVGLGHMRRNSAIAEGLSRILPEVSNLLLVGSSAGSYFELPPGTDSIKLPSILKTGRNQWSPKSLNVPNHVARNIRSSIITETALALQPDVFLVDHVPSGIWDELIPALKALKRQASRPRLVLGLRDILGDPEEIRARWEADRIYDLIDEYYDSILIYGSPDIFAAGDAYGLSGRFADRIRYCGFIHFGQKPLTPAEARLELGLGKKPVVVMTAGGGHDAFPMMQFALQSMLTRSSPLPFELIVVAGPLMPVDGRDEIERMSAELKAKFIVSTPKLQTYLAAADTIITMGGYNTVMESIAAGVPTVVIPRTGPSAEQRYRANLFSKLDLVRYVDLEWHGAAHFLGELEAALASPRRKTSALSFDGIRNSAKALAKLIDDRRIMNQINYVSQEVVA